MDIVERLAAWRTANGLGDNLMRDIHDARAEIDRLRAEHTRLSAAMVQVVEDRDRLTRELARAIECHEETAAKLHSYMALVSDLTRERDEWEQAAGVEAGLRREFMARAEAAERDAARAALEELDVMISDWASDQGFPRESSACWRLVRSVLNEQHAPDAKRCVHGTPESQVCGKCCGYD